MLNSAERVSTIKRHVVDFGAARYAFVEISDNKILRTAYVRADGVDWSRLERMARAATVEAQ